MRARIAVAVAAVLVLVPAAQARERTTTWTYAGIGPSGTLIKIATQGGGCERPLAPVVEETATSVRITARNTSPDGNTPCTADLRYDPVYIPLAAPIAGRKLLGATPSTNRFLQPLIPRVVGLSPGDAATVLAMAGLKPAVVARRGGPGLRRVVAQKGVRVAIAGTANP